MTKQGTILVVDDNKGILTAVQMLLGTCFEKVITISTPNKIKATLHDENIDVVLLDMNFSAGINTGNEGLFWLSEIKKEDASIQVVLFTAYADIDLAVRGIKEGAADFVVKPWDNAKLLETLKTAYNIRTANRKGISIATDKLVVSKESGMFWGESNAMQQLRSLIEKVARTDVLQYGTLILQREREVFLHQSGTFLRASNLVRFQTPQPYMPGIVHDAFELFHRLQKTGSRVFVGYLPGQQESPAEGAEIAPLAATLSGRLCQEQVASVV